MTLFIQLLVIWMFIGFISSIIMFTIEYKAINDSIIDNKDIMLVIKDIMFVILVIFISSILGIISTLFVLYTYKKIQKV